MIFVKFSNNLGISEEKVFEIDHIERTSPFIKTMSHLEDFGRDGFTRMKCLNTDENLIVSNNDKFWKEGEREKFLQRVSRLLAKEYIRDGMFEIYGETIQS